MNWKSISLSSALALSCFSLLAAPVQAQSLDVVQIASGLSSPLYLCSPPGDTARMFVCEQNTGRIRIIKNGSVLATPFLDIGAISASGGERGLLGLAFHPNYSGPGTGEGWFFVNFSSNNGSTVVRRYSVSSNPDVANAGSFADIVTIAQPFSNHNGGCIQFGPDGMLYVGTGDGGSANDPSNRAQDITNQLLGKMLRFDVDIAAPYIPPSNPFVGITGDDQIWAYGLRNPWRFSFDRVTGDLWIGDVGQGSREEVDFTAAGSAGGQNYGWRCMEGTVCTGMSGCTCNSGLVLPVDEYGHGGGNCSITGGYRYRGSEMPDMVGRYFYADYCADNVWSFDFNGTSISNKVNHETDLAIPGSVSITSFGEDANGELYIVDASGGQIYKVVQECAGGSSNYCVAATNSNGTTAQMYGNGSYSVADNNFFVGAAGAVPSVFALFFYGPAAGNSPIGDGTLCIGGSLYRLQPPFQTDFFGGGLRQIDFTSGPPSSGASQITGGSTWYFQMWYRDVSGGAAGFTTSDGLEVSFCP
jgi:glucose/arabinose dehydrogenase